MASIVAPYGPWNPASPAELRSVLAAMTCPWWISGGHAIELAVGRRLREHADIDVSVLRRDQLQVQRVLAGWEWWAADPPGVLRPWMRGERLARGIHDIWCRPGPNAAWRLQVMLDESSGGEWFSRRDHRVRRPIAGIGAIGEGGLPYLRPEIELYYKAKNPRPKDETDFAAVLPTLTGAQRRWLSQAIAATFGAHPWRGRLG